jgi:1-deoxy-D-xylulose-5-phosphate reductoisomerase
MKPANEVPELRRQGVTLLGATGSIGASTLDVIAQHPDRFAVAALTAHRQWEPMLDLVRRWQPPLAVLRVDEAASKLEHAVRAEGLPTRVLCGSEGLVEAATLPDADIVVAAIVGAAGLEPTMAAARSGKRVLLANKETLVLAGGLFIAAVRESGATLVPVDSEHSAIFQCLPVDYDGRPESCGVRRVLLTASGGPFRQVPMSALKAATPDQACAHPNWRMGRKISVDSATMMNKGLEVIEAHWLFGVDADAIEVVIHRESVIHSMVEYVDGSVLAQLGQPDMRTPIAHALSWPERIASGVAPLSLSQLGSLHFSRPDARRFPCLALAYDALRTGGTAPAVLNAANEVAVAAFLAGQIGFLDISSACKETMARITPTAVGCLDDAIAADREARQVARRALKLDLAPASP